MKYTIYKITNKLNGKIYIGAHKTSNVEDNYMGSGTLLKQSQREHGIEYFSKEILEVFDNPEDMFEMESKLVNEDFVNRSDTYNMKRGGLRAPELSSEFRSYYIKQSFKNGRVSAFKGKTHTPEVRKQISDRARKQKRDFYDNGGIHPFLGKTHSAESRRKMSKAAKGRGKGRANSQYGTVWICSEEHNTNKKIKKEDLSNYIQQGWRRGRILKPV